MISKPLLKGLVLALGFVTVLLIMDKYKTETHKCEPCDKETYIVTTNNITINPAFKVNITNKVNFTVEELVINYYTNSITPTFNNNGTATLIVSNICYPQQSEYFKRDPADDYTEWKWKHRHQLLGEE